MQKDFFLGGGERNKEKATMSKVCVYQTISQYSNNMYQEIKYDRPISMSFLYTNQTTIDVYRGFCNTLFILYYLEQYEW